MHKDIISSAEKVETVIRENNISLIRFDFVRDGLCLRIDGDPHGKMSMSFGPWLEHEKSIFIWSYYTFPRRYKLQDPEHPEHTEMLVEFIDKYFDEIRQHITDSCSPGIVCKSSSDCSPRQAVEVL